MTVEPTGFVGVIIVGGLAGWIAGRLLHGRGFGLVGNVFVGAVGGVLGGVLFELADVEVGGFWGRLAVAVVGAVLLVAFARVLGGGRA